MSNKGILGKILSIDKRGRLFMEIRDKRSTTEVLEENEERYCPPHRIPHSLPLVGEIVDDEPCHIHSNKGRQYGHHEPFCKILDCPNYQPMKKARKIVYSNKD